MLRYSEMVPDGECYRRDKDGQSAVRYFRVSCPDDKPLTIDRIIKLRAMPEIGDPICDDVDLFVTSVHVSYLSHHWACVEVRYGDWRGDA